MAAYVLAHDLGTSGNKATLYREDGSCVKNVTCRYPLHVEKGNRAEQDPRDWWHAVCTCSRELAGEVNPADIVALSFSGQMMGCVCVDHEGEPLRDAMIWADMRSGEQEEQLRRSIREEEFYRITGHRISSSYSATKLMWVRDNQPALYRDTYRMLNAKDYIILKLTGEFVTEPSDASSTCLFDLRNGNWSEELIGLCGLDREKLPCILPSAAVAGRVTAAAASACGLREGTPVVCGGGDGVCAAVGSGAVREGVANCCLGTSSWISYASRTPVFDPSMTTFNFAHILPGYVMPCGTMQCGGGALSWAVERLSELTNGTAIGEKDSISRYEAVCRAVEGSPVGARGLLFLPYLLGERSPRWNSMAKGSFVGLTMEHNAGDLLRAVMEGVAMNLALILDAYRSAQAEIGSLVLIGGGARNAVWRQILADVLELPIELPDQLEEATSMGAAITAGVGVGLFPDFGVVDRFLKTEHRYQPFARHARLYRRLRQVFDSCYRSLEQTCEALHRLS